jgi:hypothetical protein
MARPRAVLLASSSLSSNHWIHCAADANTGATFADDTGASAEIIDCNTEARFRPFENLDKQEQLESETSAHQPSRRPHSGARSARFHSRLSSLQLCQLGPDRVEFEGDTGASLQIGDT